VQDVSLSPLYSRSVVGNRVIVSFP